MRRSAVGIVAMAALACGRPQPVRVPTAAPVTPAGNWDGVVLTPGSAPLHILFTLDSTAPSWTGSLRVPSQDSQATAFASVTHTGDSVVLRLPGDGGGAVLRARLSATGGRLDGVVDGGGGSMFIAARPGSPTADQLVAPALRFDASRRLADSMADTVAAPPHDSPDAARLVTSDIARFWSAVDRAPPDSLAPWLQRYYLAPGTTGLRDFIPGRILSAEDLALAYHVKRARYDSVRAANLDVTKADSAIRAAFRRLKAIYPAAVFPDVYFVVGRFNSGGTSTMHGLLIGAEMYSDPAQLPGIVSHELIHFEQHYPNRTLLDHAFLEGSADFLGEMISGRHINNAAHAYGRAHEHELWREFVPHFDDTSYFPWMYGRPPGERPADLGYFIGYRIAEAYYNRTPDKARAVRDILSGAGGNVRALLARSGYDP